MSSYFKDVFLTKTRDEWFSFLSQKKDICIAPVYNFDEVFHDAQVLHREMVVEVNHPAWGQVKQPGLSIKLSDTPGRIGKLAPLPGEHTVEILLSLGYTRQQVEELNNEGAILGSKESQQ